MSLNWPLRPCILRQSVRYRGGRSMSPNVYDLAIVGGGLAGAPLATVMARAGARVLVLEREPRFRERIRGEGMHPWGVAEARTLGILEPLLDLCGHPVRWR